jgi:hypothetical protein
LVGFTWGVAMPFKFIDIDLKLNPHVIPEYLDNHFKQKELMK